MNYTQYVKPALLVFIPFLIGLGEVIKGWLFPEINEGESHKEIKVGRFKLFVLRFITTKKRIPYVIWVFAIVLSTVYGLAFSDFTGSRLAVDAVVYTGLVQGSIVGFASMGVFDTLRKKDA